MEKKVWQCVLSIVFASILSLSLTPTEVLASNMIHVISEEVWVSTSSSGGSSNRVTLGPNSEEGAPLNPSKVELSQEEAIERIRELFPVLRQAEVDRAELRADYPYPPGAEDQLVWDIGWHYQRGNSSYGFSSSIDANTGDLFSIHLTSPFREENQVYYPPQVSEDEALKKAKAFIEKAVPSINIEDLQLDKNTIYYMNQPLFGPVQYHFNFIPVIHGVPSPDAALSLTVDGNGQVVSFHRRYTLREYPSAQPAISLEEAEQQYAEHLQLSLEYMSIADTSMFLGWVPDKQVGPFELIDAQTGEFIDFTGKVVSIEQNPYQEIPTSSSTFSPIVPEDGEFISAEQAAAVVEQIAAIPAKRTLTSKTRGKHWRNEQIEVWELRWTEDGESFYRPLEDVRATVDARTGQLIEYRESMFYPRSRPTSALDEAEEDLTQQAGLSEDELQQRAFDLLNKLFPDPQANLKWLKRDIGLPAFGGEDHYYFQFQRFYQGIPVQHNQVTISLDKHGQLKEYRLDWIADLEERVQGLAAKITQEEAQAKYLLDTTMQLRYQYLRDYIPDSEVQPSMRLVYGQQFSPGLGYGYAIDAIAGQWRSSWNQGVTTEVAVREPLDVQGHAAEEELRTLVQYQIIKADESGNIHPDEAITYGEWLYMMAKAVDPYVEQSLAYDTSNQLNIPKENPYYAAVQLATRYGWLDPSTKDISLDKLITREELAGSLTYILGYYKLATYFEQEDLATYIDHEQIKAKGAVALVDKLGLMGSEDGLFAPQREVTRAEAAKVMLHLVYLQGKTDQDIGGYRR